MQPKERHLNDLVALNLPNELVRFLQWPRDFREGELEQGLIRMVVLREAAWVLILNGGFEGGGMDK